MDTWVVCPSCQLKHRLRPEGGCPRCAAVQSAAAREGGAAREGAAAPEAGVAPAPGAAVAAAPEETRMGLPPETDAVAPEGVSLPLAGGALVAFAVTNLLATFLMPQAAGEGLPVATTLAPTLFDLFIGSSLLRGHAKHLSWARFRVVLGAIVWPLVLAVQGNWPGVVLQLMVCGALALLLWGGGRVLRTVALSVLTLIIALTAAITVAARSGANPLLGAMMALKGELEPLSPGLLAGRQFSYTVDPPRGDWRLRSVAASQRDNPLADRWLVLPGSDVHLVVTAEKLDGALHVDMARFRAVVLENARKGMPDLRELPGGSPRLATLPGYIHVEGTAAGQALEMEIVLHADRGALYQLTAFGPRAGYQRAQPELAEAIRSFNAL